MGQEEDEEFLPSTEIVSSQSEALGRLEDDDEDEDDEFTASLMAAAAKDVAQVEQEDESIPSTTGIPHPRRVSPEMDDNLEDFEMISESELAECLLDLLPDQDYFFRAYYIRMISSSDL